MKKKETKDHRVCRTCGTNKEKRMFRAYYGKGQRSNILYRKWDCLDCEKTSIQETDKRYTEEFKQDMFSLHKKIDALTEKIDNLCDHYLNRK